MIDYNEAVMIAMRSIISIIALFIVTKMLGKKQISQLTVYDYIVGITIGSIAADIILSLEDHFINGVIAILIFGFVGFILSYLSIKSEEANELLNGRAVVLMENGNFIIDNLRKTKIPIYKFIEQARLKGYYDLDVLNYAILETNGEISFLPKEEYQTSTPIDFKMELKKGTKQTFCDELVMEGKVKREKLEELDIKEKWLKDELKKKKISSYDDLVLVTIDQKDKLKIFEDND